MDFRVDWCNFIVWCNMMKRFAAVLLCLVACTTSPSYELPSPKTEIAFATDAAADAAGVVQPPVEQIDVRFSPNGGCTESIVDFIHSANRKIHMLAYDFTSKPIADALIERKKAGLEVEVVLDKSNLTAGSSEMHYVEAGGVSVFVDSKHKIAHNKTILVDDVDLEDGSFNYSESAETKNAENCLFIRFNPVLVAKFEANWQVHRGHSGLAP